MDLYFSCSLTGGRGDQPVYAALVSALQAWGHTVLTAHLAQADILAEEASLDARSVYVRDMAWLDAAEAVVAEVSTPSHGVGYEIAYALLQGTPVLCLYRAGAKVSKILVGNRHPGCTMRAYADEAEAVRAAREFLEGLGD
jgi:2'-deoxynucleoside 5'-phosphate N-hydrolase